MAVRGKLILSGFASGYMFINKKVVIVSGVIILLITGVSFATGLDYYARILGTAQILAPEFYIGSAQEETLLINEKAPGCARFYVSAQYRAFKTKNLDGANFGYVPKAKFHVRAKAVGSDSQDVEVSFGYYKESDLNNPHYLCSEIITVEPQMKNYTTDFITCAEAPKNVGKLFYEFKEVCEEGEKCEGIEYIIGKCANGFYTKIELGE